ncbi:hypothetical protein CDO73_09345 [Saccharibacillus sp. O23]|nr:hypothetical protein CDO73_09345 [Saccharibacillus sp. O23]
MRSLLFLDGAGRIAEVILLMRKSPSIFYSKCIGVERPAFRDIVKERSDSNTKKAFRIRKALSIEHG